MGMENCILGVQNILYHQFLFRNYHYSFCLTLKRWGAGGSQKQLLLWPKKENIPGSAADVKVEISYNPLPSSSYVGVCLISWPRLSGLRCHFNPHVVFPSFWPGGDFSFFFFFCKLMLLHWTKTYSFRSAEYNNFPILIIIFFYHFVLVKEWPACKNCLWYIIVSVGHVTLKKCN